MLAQETPRGAEILSKIEDKSQNRSLVVIYMWQVAKNSLSQARESASMRRIATFPGVQDLSLCGKRSPSDGLPEPASAGDSFSDVLGSLEADAFGGR
jgi:hypothetical protein